MAKIKTKDEIEILREGGRRLATVLNTVAKKVKPGVTTADLDKIAHDMIRGMGDEPAFLNYRPTGAAIAFPATLCVSVNEEVVHGIPRTDRVLKEGDIVGIDLGIKHRGLFTDMALTVPVGEISEDVQKLISVTREALARGIKAIGPNSYTGDIGEAIESFALPFGYGIIHELGGHGVGHSIHEKPYIPNFGEKKTGEKLLPGMVIAIEPMLSLGSDDVVLAEDDFTYKTSDNSLAAHFELTVLITEGGAEVLTKE